MSAANTPRPRRLAGHRPSALSAANRPRKIADSRRVAVRAAGPATPEAATVDVAPPPAGLEPPVAQSEAVATAGAAARTRPRRSGLTVPLLAVVLVLAVVVGLVGWDVMRMDQRADARKSAQVVAAQSVETILSYDYARYDRGVAAAKSLMTDGFAKQYADTVRTVRPDVLKTKTVVKAQVVASSVVSAEPDQVKALLFVNQTTTGTQVQQPRVDLNRVVATLVRGSDGAWKVSDIDAL
jgi:Mce-associated membrane protein